jgi:hypothetical protein
MRRLLGKVAFNLFDRLIERRPILGLNFGLSEFDDI